MDANGGCEVAGTGRERVGWMGFRKSGELLKGRK